MLVCHKWYAIGSQAASLWMDIDCARHGAFAPVLLTRSLGAPIRLCGLLNPQTDNMLSAVVADNGPRVCELDLWVGSKLSHTTSILQSILAVDMPRLRILSVSRLGSGSANVNGLTVVADPDAPARFPALEAMLLGSFLFVPAHALPQLTHLHLAWLDDIDPSRILDLLRNTPALQVLDVIQSSEYTSPQQPVKPRWASVFLPRLHSVYLWSLASTTVHALMTHLEAPSLASVRLESIRAKSGALVSTPLIPDTLAARTVTRLAFDLNGVFSSFCAAFHGPDLSLSMDIKASGMQDTAQASRWAFDDFPAILSLSGVDELHFQAHVWPDAGADLLLHLAARMPAVSTLVVKHSRSTSTGDDDTEGLMDLARAVVALLSSDDPVLFPSLAHLELIVGDIPEGFCEILAPALAQRALDGRRLRKLRVRLDYAYQARLAMRWMFEAEPDYSGTGVYEHVDSVKIDKKKSIGRAGDEDGEELSNMVGWGEWRDSVQPARHEYWYR
ncbi:hypothetical protein GSI_07912 [Ganoderma sinense ZZ0214-1]|uniref:F-box domain-containing protein n=1 Tax=Ganoderma sinense ZZ0214-1 TaxID=1077348 RepID=A0A2G8S8B7_9APHY|nr:hypothetical protein GSI_07912 [Ganoderma sinense ZZ0214-1]